MSAMALPESLPSMVLAHVLACDQCEAMRRPRMFVCDYHDGWWDGWEAASDEGVKPCPGCDKPLSVNDWCPRCQVFAERDQIGDAGAHDATSDEDGHE